MNDKRNQSLALMPSDKSLSPMARPIVMLKRSLLKHHKVKAHQHSWGQFLYAQAGVLIVSTDNFQYICPA